MEHFLTEGTIALGDTDNVIVKGYYADEADSIYRGLGGNRYGIWNKYTGDKRSQFEMTAWLDDEESFSIVADPLSGKDVRGDADNGWTVSVEPVVHELKFDVGAPSNSATKVITRKIIHNDILNAEVENPTANDYEFIGWFNGNTKWDISQPIDADATYVARWKAKEKPVAPVVKKAVPNTVTK